MVAKKAPAKKQPTPSGSKQNKQVTSRTTVMGSGDYNMVGQKPPKGARGFSTNLKTAPGKFPTIVGNFKPAGKSKKK
jgi:hypothetical protein